ncbi:MAG: VWA domain-containing protein [Pyrinomonadaceae bacterium MAG19_C2-C3]|nr:VWA domain-containing protein [Pyrinomonadaceae bacterium MAG19_C2-C3]
MNLRNAISSSPNIRICILCAFIMLVAWHTTASPQQRQRRVNPSSGGTTQSATPATAPNISVPVTAPPPPPPTPRPTPPPVEAAAPIEDDGDVISFVSKLVVVPVAVTDAAGMPVKGLTAGDFRIEERGKPQQVAQVGDADEVPLELALLIDVSGSVQGRFDFELEAAARFLRQIMKPNDRVTLFAVDTAPQRIGTPRATLDEALAQLKLIQPKRQATAFFDTVVEAARYLASSTPPTSRRVIVCLSDGEDTNSERMKARIEIAARLARSQGATRKDDPNYIAPQVEQTQAQTHDLLLRATLPEVQRADAVFYAINPAGGSIYLNVRARRGQDGMQKISATTGGTSFLPNVLEDLDAVFNQIAAELRAQYLIQYYSNNTATTGEYLPIQVRTPNRAALRVRARQGYYSK